MEPIPQSVPGFRQPGTGYMYQLQCSWTDFNPLFSGLGEFLAALLIAIDHFNSHVTYARSEYQVYRQIQDRQVLTTARIHGINDCRGLHSRTCSMSSRYQDAAARSSPVQSRLLAVCYEERRFSLKGNGTRRLACVSTRPPPYRPSAFTMTKHSFKWPLEK